MNKKRFYHNHPYINASGSYTFKDGNNSNEYQNSDSVPLRFDKFRRNDLFTTYVGDPTNEKILQSYFDERNFIQNSDGTGVTRLKYNSPSFVRIDSLFIDFNSNNLSGTVNDTMFYGFIVNELALALNHDENVPDNTLDVHEQILNPTQGETGDYDGKGKFGRQLRPLKNADGSFKDWQSIHDIVFTQNDGSGGGPDLDGDRRTLDELGEFYQFNPPVLDDSKPEDVPGYVLQDAVILQGLNQGDVRHNPELPDVHANDDNYSGPEPDVFVHGDSSNIDNFRPKEIFYVSQNNTNTVTKIFDEGPGKQFNTIYFIFYLKGNKSGGDKKNKRFQIYEINPLDLFQTDIGGNVIGGKETTFDLGEGIIIDQTDHNQIPAFKITEFKVTINTLDGAGSDYNPNENYDQELISSILPPQRSNPININRLDENILTINPYRELISTPTLTANPVPMEYTDFIPTSHIKIKNTSQDVQMYYDTDVEKQIASAPTNVEISFTISNITTDKNELKDRRTDIIGNEDRSNYFFTVIDWNDIDNKYETIQDVLNDFPTNSIELTNKRKDNLYYFNDIYKPLFNNYTTPGIKNIKVLLFNYTTDLVNNNIEPTRWKLITSRIFLDIPVNQFPDFGEVGGGDYTTIPWPYTTPVIGGISQDSKYLKSIDDILGGGKIGDLDIIDETFLVDAKENDELGANIQVMDLEQVRYFNTGSYDIHTLLNIEPMQMGTIHYKDDFQSADYFFNSENINTPEHLSTLPFPKYREEFDITGDGGINITDIYQWGNPNDVNRKDIMDLLIYLYIGSTTVDLSQYTYPDYVSSLVTIDDIPSGIVSIDPDVFRPYNYIINSPNEIEDPLFKVINHNNYNTSNGWFGELVSSGNRIGTDLYEQKEYDDNSKGIHIKYTATDITGATYTFFRYMRKDLNLKTFDEGGTEYTFKFEIKFNEFSPNAPSRYVFRVANRDNDWGTPLHNTDGFQRNETSFYRGDDGIYSNSDLTNKLGDYGEWITIERTRKLISDYASTRGGELQEIDGYPNMEFLTSNWNDTWDNGSEAILDFDIRNPIMMETKTFNEITDESILNQNTDYWSGLTPETTFPMESSVGQIFINDNQDNDLKNSCQIELNTGDLIGKSINDSSGNSNKGLLIGDYKMKKNRKGEPMRRDSFIKVPKTDNNTNGAL